MERTIPAPIVHFGDMLRTYGDLLGDLLSKIEIEHRQEYWQFQPLLTRPVGDLRVAAVKLEVAIENWLDRTAEAAIGERIDEALVLIRSGSYEDAIAILDEIRKEQQ